MRLRKALNRRVEGKPYYRYLASIPAKLLEALGWTEDDELEIVPRSDGLLIRRVK